MAHHEVGIDISLPAAADLSASQYCVVYVDSNGRAALAGEGASAVGILQNKPSAIDRAAQVRVFGVSKIKGGDTVTAGSRISTGANGLGVGVGSGDDWSIGVALDAAANGKISTVLIQPTGPTV